jgi:hypothetical protein
MIGLSKDRQDTYTMLIAIAALGVPLDLEALTKPAVWGLEPSSSGYYNNIPMLDVLRLFNLYIERSRYDGQWRIIFPEVAILLIVSSLKIGRASSKQREMFPCTLMFRNILLNCYCIPVI